MTEAPGDAIRIVIADDSYLIREALSGLLGGEPSK